MWPAQLLIAAALFGLVYTENQTTTSSILDELLNWQVPDLTYDPSIVPPKQFAASCSMLCSVGWEDDMSTSPFTRMKIMRCSTKNLTAVEFNADECNEESGACSRVLESL